MEKSQLTKEFEKEFGSLLSRIRVSLQSQEETITQYLDLLPEEIPIPLKRVISASYLLCLTEEIYEVSFENFQKDLLTFCEILGLNIEEVSEISEEKFIQTYLEPFIQILLITTDVLQEMLKQFIAELASGYEERLVKTLVIYNYFSPLFEKILQILDRNVDLRFVAAILTNSIENFIDRKTRLKTGVQLGEFSFSSLYYQFKEDYPLTEGKDLIFDICNKLTIERTWDPLQTLVKKEIDALAESIESQREDSLAQYKANIAREKEKYSDDYYVSMIAGRIFEVFVMERVMTDTLRTGLVNAVDVMIRRYLIDKHGYASASGEDTLEIACNLLWETVWEAPQILAAILEPKEIMEVMKADKPKKWFKTHEKEFKQRFCQQLTRYAGMNPQPAVVGNAFVKLLETSQKMKVRITFD